MLVKVIKGREECWVEQFDERIELEAMELHWSSREQQHRLGPNQVWVGEFRGESVQLGVGVLPPSLVCTSRMVRLVDNDHVPAGCGNVASAITVPTCIGAGRDD